MSNKSKKNKNNSKKVPISNTNTGKSNTAKTAPVKKAPRSSKGNNSVAKTAPAKKAQNAGTGQKNIPKAVSKTLSKAITPKPQSTPSKNAPKPKDNRVVLKQKKVQGAQTPSKKSKRKRKFQKIVNESDEPVNRDPTVFDGKQWNYVPLDVTDFKQYYDTNVMKLLLQFKHVLYPVHTLNLDRMNQTDFNDISDLLDKNPERMNKDNNDVIVLVTTDKEEHKAMFFHAQKGKGYVVYYRDPIKHDIPDIIIKNLDKIKNLISDVKDVSKNKKGILKGHHKGQYVVDYIDKFIDKKPNFDNYNEDYLKKMRAAHDKFFTNKAIFDNKTLWDFLEKEKSVLIDRPKMKNADLDDSNFNLKIDKYDNNTKRWPWYEVSTVMFLLGYRIFHDKIKETKIVLVPLNQNYHSYSFQQINAHSINYNIAGIINRANSHYIAFYVKKRSKDKSELLFMDPLNGQIPAEINTQCKRAKLNVESLNLKFQLGNDNDNCGPWCLWLLGELCAGRRPQSVIYTGKQGNKDRNYSSFINSNRRKVDQKILDSTLFGADTYIDLMEKYVYPIILPNTEEQIPSPDGRIPDIDFTSDNTDEVNETDDPHIVHIEEEQEDTASVNSAVTIHVEEKEAPVIIPEEVRNTVHNQGVNRGTQTKPMDEVESLSFSDSYRTCLRKQNNNIWLERRKQPFVFRNVNIDESINRTLESENSRTPKEYARDYIDEEGHAFVRCDKRTFKQQELQHYIYRKLKKGKYSQKLKFYCAFSDDDFDEWRPLKETTYYVIKNDRTDKAIRIQQQTAQTLSGYECPSPPKAHHKHYVYVPIAQWQYKDVRKNVHIKKRINSGSEQIGISEPSLERLFNDSTFAFK